MHFFESQVDSEIMTTSSTVEFLNSPGTLLYRRPSFTIEGDLQYIQHLMSTGSIRVTSTSLCKANDISTAKMCLHFTPRNLWSGHEQTQPNSVELTS